MSNNPRQFESDILVTEAEIAAMSEDDLELYAQQLVLDYRKVFLSTKAGQRVLSDILRRAKTLAPIMTGNSYIYHNEGARALGLYIQQNVGLTTVDQLVGILARSEGYE